MAERKDLTTGMRLVHAHMDRAGVIGCWELLAEAIDAELARLTRIVAEVDDVLVVSWVGPRIDGDYRKALADLIQGAISEHEYFEADRLRALSATLPRTEGCD